MSLKNYLILTLSFLVIACEKQGTVETVALWCFDEQMGLYPSCVLSDLSDNDYPLVLGRGGQIVAGKFGGGLAALNQENLNISESPDDITFGMTRLPVPEGRTQEPMNWFNAYFAALMTSGETHLRKQVGFPQPTKTDLNLGNFNWTVEFWLNPAADLREAGVIFELGTGPRGENDQMTSLKIKGDYSGFILYNQPSGTNVNIPTRLIPNQWQHIALTFDAGNSRLSHYIDGKSQVILENITLNKLTEGAEDYLTIGRSGIWSEPLPGVIDELRFSKGLAYQENFQPPASFSYLYAIAKPDSLLAGPVLLFSGGHNKSEPVNLGKRKHLFIDDALLEKSDGVSFVVNPARPAEIVLSGIEGKFRKHLGVVEDDDGRIRIYTTVDDDYLAVWISDDGVNFHAPVLPEGRYKGHNNIVLHASVGMGIVFKDPNAPKAERWKYVSDYHRRAVALFHSEDGLSFKRYRQPVLPFRSGSQCNLYYDDQKQVYTAFHRSDFGRTGNGATQRDFVMTETSNLLRPWPFKPLNQAEALKRAAKHRTADLIPWYLDNGPLTPGGFADEYPWIFSPVDTLDPAETDIYVPKVIKYPWAPDTYLAFPVVYFHYEKSNPVTRMELMNPARQRGSGPLESQLAVSRNGTDWHRYPRPAYVGIGQHGGIDFKTSYIAHGMIRRGNEIWQYNFSEPHYHSPWITFPEKRAVYRLVQRLDGFVSMDAPYDREVTVTSRPVIFSGSRLILNIDTDAAGYAQIGFTDVSGEPVSGYSVDDCIYINGDFIDAEVEWMKNRIELAGYMPDSDEELAEMSQKVDISADVSQLAGKPVRLVIRMRGAKLYALQFVEQ